MNNMADELQKGFMNVLINVEVLLLKNKPDECLKLVMQTLQEIYGDINKESPVAQQNDSSKVSQLNTKLYH